MAEQEQLRVMIRTWQRKGYEGYIFALFPDTIRKPKDAFDFQDRCDGFDCDGRTTYLYGWALRQSKPSDHRFRDAMACDSFLKEIEEAMGKKPVVVTRRLKCSGTGKEEEKENG